MPIHMHASPTAQHLCMLLFLPAGTILAQLQCSSTVQVCQTTLFSSHRMSKVHSHPQSQGRCRCTWQLTRTGRHCLRLDPSNTSGLSEALCFHRCGAEVDGHCDGKPWRKKNYIAAVTCMQSCTGSKSMSTSATWSMLPMYIQQRVHGWVVHLRAAVEACCSVCQYLSQHESPAL